MKAKNERFIEKPCIGDDSVCIEVEGKHHVMITRTDEGVVVDVYQLPYNVESEFADDADATCCSFDKEDDEPSSNVDREAAELAMLFYEWLGMTLTRNAYGKVVDDHMGSYELRDQLIEIAGVAAEWFERTLPAWEPCTATFDSWDFHFSDWVMRVVYDRWIGAGEMGGFWRAMGGGHDAVAYTLTTEYQDRVKQEGAKL